MSRCFPFPPPNYRKERDLNGDLRFTESIKKEPESLSKEKRKDRKRERKEKKDKSNDVSLEKLKHGQRSHKKQKLNDNDAPHSTVWFGSKSQHKKNPPSMKDGYNNGATELTRNKLQTKDERSGITEERTLRVLTPVPCESSESTENSSKAGNSILRFKLPRLKPEDQKPALAVDLPSTSNKTGPRIVEATQANEEPCFTGRKTTKVKKNPSASEATYFVGRITPEPKVLKASQALPSKGATSFSAQPAPKPKGASAFPISEAARCSSRAIPRPKIDVPSFSDRAPPRPIALKPSPATEAARLSGRSLPEHKALKATPLPRFSGRVTPRPDVRKAPPASKEDIKTEAVKALPASKANCFSVHNLPKSKVIATQAKEVPCFTAWPAPNISKASVVNATPGVSVETFGISVATQAKEVPCFPAWPAPNISKASAVNATPGVSVETFGTSVATALNEAPCSSGHATKAHTTELKSSERISKRIKKHRDDPGLMYEKLFSNWKPEPLIVHEEEDLSWLYSKSEKQSKVKSEAPISDAKRCAADNEVEKLTHLNPAYAFQPRARYLPEVDVYAIPYTVPF